MVGLSESWMQLRYSRNSEKENPRVAPARDLGGGANLNAGLARGFGTRVFWINVSRLSWLHIGFVTKSGYPLDALVKGYNFVPLTFSIGPCPEELYLVF